jgi:hypothetical protein
VVDQQARGGRPEYALVDLELGKARLRRLAKTHLVDRRDEEVVRNSDTSFTRRTQDLDRKALVEAEDAVGPVRAIEKSLGRRHSMGVRRSGTRPVDRCVHARERLRADE